MKLVLAASLALVTSVGAAGAAPFSATVRGTDAVYGAGLTGGGVSTAPQSIGFSAGFGNVLTFSSIIGATNCCGGSPGTGPDGSGGVTSVSALNGLSGIVAPGTMFLVGVFVDSANFPASGDTPPPTLNYSSGLSTGSTSYAPLLNQTFFIGDGLTGTGTGSVQSFLAPDAADTLLLGFADSFGFNGTPSYYGDNTGSLSVLGDITTPVPLPAGLPLLGGTLALLALVRKMTRV